MGLNYENNDEAKSDCERFSFDGKPCLMQLTEFIRTPMY